MASAIKLANHLVNKNLVGLNSLKIMFIIGAILAAIGGIIMFVYGIILLIQAFKESILWGLGYLFVPFCSLVFIFMHWDKCKTPFLRLLIGLVIYAVGFGLLTPSLIEKAKEQQMEQQGQAVPNP